MKTTENETLIKTVIEYLIRENISVATAESCTAGMIAAALGDIPGVSSIFNEGFVTYSNEAKMKNLGVLEDTLSSFGAVSEQTAREMAEGVRKRTGARIGVSSTGIAGPDGGTKEKPVGLVFIGVSLDGKTTVTKNIFSGDRKEVREQTVFTAFSMISKIFEIDG